MENSLIVIEGGGEKTILCPNVPVILSSAFRVRFGYFDILREVILEVKTYSLKIFIHKTVKIRRHLEANTY